MDREEARGVPRPRRHRAEDRPAEDDLRIAAERGATPGEPSAAGDPGSDNDSDNDAATDEAASLRLRDDLDEGGEQAEFREQFDEDLYNDREDRPAQGNTADVAMEHRFGSDADAYAEYAWRRPGDHHRGDESAVGQARDPADIADEDESP